MYLRKIRKVREEGKKIIHMDKTWVNAHHNSNYLWVNKDHKEGWQVPSGKGHRLIIIHAGLREERVNNASLVFQSKSSTGDEINISWNGGTHNYCPIYQSTLLLHLAMLHITME